MHNAGLSLAPVRTNVALSVSTREKSHGAECVSGVPVARSTCTDTYSCAMSHVPPTCRQPSVTRKIGRPGGLSVGAGDLLDAVAEADVAVDGDGEIVMSIFGRPVKCEKKPSHALRFVAAEVLPRRNDGEGDEGWVGDVVPHHRVDDSGVEGGGELASIARTMCRQSRSPRRLRKGARREVEGSAPRTIERTAAATPNPYSLRHARE